MSDKQNNRPVGLDSTGPIVVLTLKEIQDRPNDQELGAYVRAILQRIEATNNSGKQILLG